MSVVPMVNKKSEKATGTGEACQHHKNVRSSIVYPPRSAHSGFVVSSVGADGEVSLTTVVVMTTRARFHGLAS